MAICQPMTDWRSGQSYLSMFHSLAIRIVTCFALGLHPEVREQLRNMFKVISTFRQADEELEIHCILKRLIQPISFFKYSAAEKRCSSGNVQDAVIEKNKGAELDLPS